MAMRTLEQYLVGIRPRDYSKWGSYGAPSRLKPPKEWVENVKRNCPRNAPELIRLYGKLTDENPRRSRASATLSQHLTDWSK